MNVYVCDVYNLKLIIIHYQLIYISRRRKIGEFIRIIYLEAQYSISYFVVY